MKDNLTLILAILGAVGTWSVSVALFAWWLSNQFKETRHTIQGSMDMRFSILDEKIDIEVDKLDGRVRKVELHIAQKNGVVL